MELHPPPCTGAGAAGRTKDVAPWVSFIYWPDWKVWGSCCGTGGVPCPFGLRRLGLRSVVGAPPAAAPDSSATLELSAPVPAPTPAMPAAVPWGVLTLRGIIPALIVPFLVTRAVLFLPREVLLRDRFGAKGGGGGTLAGFETDCARRAARMVAASGRTPTGGWRVVLERSRAVGRATIGSVPIFAREGKRKCADK